MLQEKPLFLERMKKLLEEEDLQNFLEISRQEVLKSIRCNTLKISPDELKRRLEERGWQIRQPYPEFPEIMIVENKLMPGELGKSIEHLLGYFYVQEISSMMPVLALNPEPQDIILDLAAAPGSKTTYMASKMQNQGTIIANDKTFDRTIILSTNLERCGCTNVIITRHDAVQLCERLNKLGMRFDKILLDLPCSGEGNIRGNPETLKMWNIKMIKKLSRLQKKLASSAIQLLKSGGELVYSTCTLTPEENESVVSFLAEKFNLEIIPVRLPLKCRPGIKKWEKENFQEKINLSCRIYPQDNNTEGFFLAKLQKLKVSDSAQKSGDF